MYPIHYVLPSDVNFLPCDACAYDLLPTVHVYTIDYLLPAGVQSTASGGDEDRRGEESQTAAGPGSATGDQ